MSALLDQLSELTRHPYYFSYVALTTYMSFVRKKGSVVKKSLEDGINGFAELNHVLCRAIRRCCADWRGLRKQPIQDRPESLVKSVMPE